MTWQTHYSKKDGSVQYSYRCGGYAPDTEDGSEETELSIAEAEAVVKAVAELLFPFLPAEIDEGGGAHEGI